MNPSSDAIVHRLMLAIAHGAHLKGETLPAETELAQSLLVSPQRVRAAYEELVREEIVIAMEEHGFMIDAEARPRAKDWLVRKLEAELTTQISELRAIGCDQEKVTEAVERAIRTFDRRRGA